MMIPSTKRHRGGRVRRPALELLEERALLSLSINGAQTFQTIDGFGANINAHSWNGGELRPALDMLNDQMGVTLYRVVYDMEDWESTNDNADPNTPDRAYYSALYSSASFQELWGTLHYLNQKGVSGGITLSFMGRVPPWMGGSVINAALEDEWVESIATLVDYARNTEHVQFALLDPLNEPDWDGIEGPQVSADQYTRLLHKLSERLDAMGLGDIRFLGPSTASIDTGVNTYMPAMMSDPVVMGKVDHFGFHNYAGYTAGADAAIKGSAYPSKNFWITEVTNPWDIMTHIAGNPSAVLVWDGYDSAYIHPTLHGASLDPPNDAGNGPAPIAYDTATGVYTPRQSFYQDEQIFKYVPPGSVRVGATESNGNLTVYAFYHQPSGRVTIVGRNEGGSSINVAGSLSNLPMVASFQAYETDAGSNFLRLADVAVSNGLFSFVAPGNSFFTLTALTAPDTTPPAVSVTAPADGSTVHRAVTVSAASDNVAVAGVQFLLDGQNLGAEDTTSPYAISWDTATAGNGSHVLQARARDAAGNTTTSAAVTVTVANLDATPPTVALTAPADGATLSGTVTVSAVASDDVVVAGVQFLLDGAPLGTEYTNAPYSISWNTATVAGGSHTLSARARDAAGNQAMSTSITVKVSNSAPAGQIQFSAPTYSMNETGGSVTITVSRTGGGAGAVSVQYATSDGTAKSGTDYTAVTNTLSWGDGDTASKTFTIPILDDPQFDGDETINLALTSLKGTILGTPSTATVTIHDEPAVLQFTDAQFTANVTDGAKQVVLTRTGNFPATVTVVVSSPGGHDVAAFQQTVTFGPNTPSATVTVPIQNDGQPGEPDVAIPLSLSSPGPGSTLGAIATATLVVHDNNPFPPLVTITSLTHPTIRVKIGTGRRARTKTETVLQLTLSGAVNGAGNLAAYQLLSGKTRRGVTTFNKLVPLTSAVYNPTALTVTLFPAGKLNLSQPKQLRVAAALLTDVYGRPLRGGQNFVATFSNQG
jgi:O-glycosyl hydrolase